MRIDKFLNVCNLVKSRNIAIDMMENNAILVNSKIAKKSYKIKYNDKIKMVFLDKEIVFKIIQIPQINNIKKEDKEKYIKII